MGRVGEAAEQVITGCRAAVNRMPYSGSVLCFSERRRKRDRAPLDWSSEKLRADPIEARRPDLRSAAFYKRLSSRGTRGPVLRASSPGLRSHQPAQARLAECRVP